MSAPAPHDPSTTHESEFDSRPVPPAPAALGDAGRAFWQGVAEEFEEGWRLDELRTLLDVCHTMDLVDRMQSEVAGQELLTEGSTGQLRISPLVPELRNQRTLLSTLLARLDLRSGVAESRGDDERLTPSEAGRRAAMARWTNKHTSGMAGGQR